ncbi:protein SHORT HYPOCOTYL IN WHITE LIGHT 1 [Euphorbia lathyris]|uniref:protein SHORT HYPOCOTYL IN WHITE LIGHT 1 n=1 Tax=Euphorbia lathyris TaxID=212925 RepID=UPI0033140E29
MPFTLNLSPYPPSSSSSSSTSLIRKPQLFTSHPNLNTQFFSPELPPPSIILRASRRISNNNTSNTNLVGDPRIWSRAINNDMFDDADDDDEDDEEEEEDRSLDLLARFFENVFKKVSKRARKAVRSVLPPSISTKLVAFSVNGVIMLAFLWILKAFLQVVCTLGTAVFVSILLIRGIWSGIAYLQESRYLKMNEHDDDHLWSSTQPAT